MTFWQNVLKIVQDYWPNLLMACRTTLLVSLLGTACGFLIGLLIGGLRAIKLDFTASKTSRILKRIFDALAGLYITVFRGTPMMVQAVFIYYALLNIIHWSNIQAAVFVISVNTGAYMAEIIRSGIQAVDNGQIEAARSLGMSNAQTLKEVVLPQAIRNAFPAIGNELIVNIKDSSVLMIISISELMFSARSIAGTTFRFTEVYFIEACIYLFLTSVAALLLNWVEKRVNGSGLSLPQSDTDPANMKLSRTPEQKGGNRDYDARQHS